MDKIAVKRIAESENAIEFAVSADGRNFKVSLDMDYYRQLTGRKIGPEKLIKKSFEFLLKHESADFILSEFNLKVIQQYFPEYEKEIVRK